jgi:hypothetical protein
MSLAGLRLGRGGVWVGAGRAFGLGPGARYFSFFQNFFSVQKNFKETLYNSFKALKILRKSEKFQENSQRHIGT